MASFENAHFRAGEPDATTLALAFGLEREVALITGGGSGLGLGMARAFVAAGARVVLVGRRPVELAAAAAALGERVAWVAHDITRLAAASALVAAAAAAAGALPTILVNNAGIHLKKPAVQVSAEEFQEVLQTHVLAAHALTRAALPSMLERRHGSILFTASMAALFGLPGTIAYAAAKSAYLGMVRTLATEVSPEGVRVNAIAPGWIDSAMMQQAMQGDPGRRKRVLDRTPLGRFGDASDISWAAVYLCSPAARFVTGAVLPVDGGVSIGF